MCGNGHARDRNRWFADDGVCQRRAGIYSSERSASVGCPATQLFLDDQPEVIAPEPPTWREFLESLDAKDYTASGIKLRLEQIGFEPSQLDEEMDESWWEMHYDRISGPSAKAYRLLERIDLGPDLGRSGDGLISSSGRAAAISSIIRSSDMLALSLLQARLIDLRLPIKVERWKD